jgi:hypothetical protein
MPAAKGGAAPAAAGKKTWLYLVCVLRKRDECIVASFAASKDVSSEDVTDIVGEKSGKLVVGKRYSEAADEGIMVHFVCDEKDRIYAIMTKSNYPQRLAYAVLEELKSSFGGEFGARVKASKPNGLSADAKPLLKSLVDKYGDPASSGDALTKVQAKLDQAKDTMKENIEVAIRNTELIEDIEEQSEALEKSSAQFSKNAEALRKKMWWKKVKTYLLIGGLILSVLLIIIVPIAVQASAGAAAVNAAEGSNSPPAPSPPPPPPTAVPTMAPTKKKR